MAERETLAHAADSRRSAATAVLQRDHRARLGQFFTPAPVARLIAAQFNRPTGHVRLLDPGAGIGALAAAFVARVITEGVAVSRLDIVAYEIEPAFHADLARALRRCSESLARRGIACAYEVRKQDFLEVPSSLQRSLPFGPGAIPPEASFTHAILNPPYRKIHSRSREHRVLAEAGIHVPNLYSAFVWKAVQLLEQGGELAAITPRSFCNGPYFRRFRAALLRDMALDRIHVYESRTAAFAEDAVLQENVIFHAVKGAAKPPQVAVTSIKGNPGAEAFSTRLLPYSDVVRPGDREQVIHIIGDDAGQRLKAQMEALPATLTELGLDVSTGPVVDFRLKEHLLPGLADDSVPLLYPEAVAGDRVLWPPRKARKPTAILHNASTDRWLTQPGWYVLTRRFTAKEEKRRVVAAVCHPLDAPAFGIENHLNYFHVHGRGMDADLARGLAAFLNSTMVDDYFRQFSGHTQVNASDLRRMRYPAHSDLLTLGRRADGQAPAQEQIDSWLRELLAEQERS